MFHHGNLKDYLLKLLNHQQHIIIIFFTPVLKYYGTKTRVKFTRSCLKQPKISYNHGKIVNNYIVYELGTPSSHNNDSTLKYCLFGAFTLTKNADIDQYGYLLSSLSFPGGGFGQNVIIFEADMSFSAHIDNKKKDKDQGPTQWLEQTLTAKKCMRLILLLQKRNFVQDCITMEQIVTCLLMVLKFTNLRQKILRL